MPLDFTDHIKFGDIVKIHYKKFAHEKKFDFIMANTLGTPMSTDYTDGDFSVEYANILKVLLIKPIYISNFEKRFTRRR